LDPSAVEPFVILPATATSFDDTSPMPGASYAVVAVDLAGHASAPVTIVPGAQPTDAAAPATALRLRSIAPNPANPGAWIEFDLPAESAARVAIYDAHGRPVRVIAARVTGSGGHRMYWDGRDTHSAPVASGVYWVALETASERRGRRLVIIR
jgi:hypothetical protein